MKLSIPKGFFENKNYLDPKELLSMFAEMVEKIEELEEDRNANFEWGMREMEKNRELEANNKLLKDALLKKDIEIMKLKEQLEKEVGA